MLAVLCLLNRDSYDLTITTVTCPKLIAVGNAFRGGRESAQRKLGRVTPALLIAKGEGAICNAIKSDTLPPGSQRPTHPPILDSESLLG